MLLVVSLMVVKNIQTSPIRLKVCTMKAVTCLDVMNSFHVCLRQAEVENIDIARYAQRLG